MRSPVSPRAVVVMGKVPRPGSVKTRLARVLSDDVAARLYRAFLADVFSFVDRAQSLVPGGFAPIFACALGAGDRLEDARRLAPSAWRVIAQRGAGLGDRIEACFEDADACEVVVLGSDSPALDATRLVDAFAALAGARARRAVVGPTVDGGYYLVGAGAPVPELFVGVPWSSAEVLAVTRQRAAGAAIQLVELATAYDVDEPEDLRVLHRDLERSGAVASATRLALDAEPTVRALLERDGPGEAR